MGGVDVGAHSELRGRTDGDAVEQCLDGDDVRLVRAEVDPALDR